VAHPNSPSPQASVYRRTGHENGPMPTRRPAYGRSSGISQQPQNWACRAGLQSPEVNPGTLTDAELVAGCRRGEDVAWRELVQRFSRYVYAIAPRAYGLRDRDAEDVFQEVFARTYERLDSLRSDDAIRPWIAQLTRRLSVDRLRASSREVPSEETPDLGDPAAEDAI